MDIFVGLELDWYRLAGDSLSSETSGSGVVDCPNWLALGHFEKALRCERISRAGWRRLRRLHRHSLACQPFVFGRRRTNGLGS